MELENQYSMVKDFVFWYQKLHVQAGTEYIKKIKIFFNSL